jgi:hypothetical protein
MTMDIFNRINPAYKTAANAPTAAYPQPAATSGGLSGLLGSLFGNATPTYKTVDGGGGNASAPSSSGLLGSLLGSAAPSYQTAPAPAATENPDDGPIDAATAGNGVVSSMSCDPTVDEVVLL